METKMIIGFDTDTNSVVLTNTRGDVYISKCEMLHDFLYGCEEVEDPKPTDIAGYPIDWESKTISVPQEVQEHCSSIYKAIEDVAEELGLKIQLST